MARKPKAATGTDNQRFGGQGSSSSQRIEFTFINVAVNTADINWLLSNEGEAAGIILEFLSTISDGYKLSCNFDKQSGRFNATLACSVVDDPNYALILSFRGKSAADALYGLAYSDLRKLEGEWRRAADEPTARFG